MRYNPFTALDKSANQNSSTLKASQENRRYDLFNSDFYKQQMEAVFRLGNEEDTKDSSEYLDRLIAETKVRETLEVGQSQSAASTPRGPR